VTICDGCKRTGTLPHDPIKGFVLTLKRIDEHPVAALEIKVCDACKKEFVDALKATVTAFKERVKLPG